MLDYITYAPGVLALVFMMTPIVIALYFAWNFFTGTSRRMADNFGSASKANIAKVNPKDASDATLWLPDFAQKTNVDVISRHNIGNYSYPMTVAVKEKSQEQMDDEKRAYFAEKARRS